MRSDPSPVWPSLSHYSLRPKPQFPLKQLGWVSIATVAVLSTKPDRPNMAPRPAAESSLLTPRWREVDSNLYGAFPVKRLFWVVLTAFCSERDRPFFVPAPGITFPEPPDRYMAP